MTEDIGNPGLTLVDDVPTAERFLSWLGERRPVLAIDTETTGLEWWTPHFTRLVQFGDGEQGWAVSVRDWRGVIAIALDRIKDEPVVYHNAKFDAHALEVEGLTVPEHRRSHDTYIMHHLLDPGNRHDLKGLLEQRYGDIAGVGSRMLKLRMHDTKTDWATIDERDPVYWAYAALDTVLTARLAEDLWPKVQPWREQYDREMAYLWIMYDAEKRGMRVDPTYAEILRTEWLSRAATLADGLKEEGIKNPNSNKQITDALEAAGWEPDEWTPSGAVKLDKAILLQLQREFPGDMAERILEFRRLLKWSKTYLLPFAESGGTVHPSIRTLGARTGRSSVSGPPIQQLPSKGTGGKLIRQAVLPFAESQRLYAVDYDAQELRLHAHFSNSTHMIEAFRQGIDPHSFTASLAYKVAIEDVQKFQRDPAKNTRYAKLYGAGNPKIAATAGVPVEVIDEVVAAIDAAFPEERVFSETLEAVANQRWADEGIPYVVSSGGRRVIGDGEKLYALLNYLIQGSAADILKDKVIELSAAGLDQHIVIPVHDELLFSFPMDDGDELVREAAGIMEELEAFKVPLTVGASGPFSTWGDHYA